MKLLLEDITLNQLRNTGVSSTTSHYADERFGLMGDESVLTQLVSTTYVKAKDYILAKFVTEATEKYPDDYIYKDVSHRDHSLQINPSASYELWIMFYPVLGKLREKGASPSQDAIKAILPECNVKVWSNSPSFHYQGFNYNLSQQAASLFPTTIRPQKWDKIHGHALLDKHLYLAMNSINKYFDQIASKVVSSIPNQEPLMTEAKIDIKQKHNAVFSIGRMNPYTHGHEKLIDKLIATALAIKGDAVLFLTHTQDQKKNPLSWEQKVNFVRQATAGKNIKICDDPNVLSAFDAANWLYNHQYTDVVAIFGSDRVPEMEVMYQKYNKKETTRGYYDFNTIQVVSAGDRDPDAEGVEGFSATKARNAAVDNDFNTFFKIVGTTNQNLAKQMMVAVRKGMGLQEDMTPQALDKFLTKNNLKAVQKVKKRDTGKTVVNVQSTAGIDRDAAAEEVAFKMHVHVIKVGDRPVIEDPSLDPYVLHFKPTPGVGKKTGEATQRTEKQETATAYAMYRVIEQGEDPTIEELQQIFPECDKKWYNSIIKSSHAFQRWAGRKGYIYSRGSVSYPESGQGAIHDMVKHMAKALGFKSADLWNPSDIYVCKASRLSVIQNFFVKMSSSKDSQEEKLQKVNSFLARELENKTMIGVSLKQVKKDAKVEYGDNPEDHRIPTLTMEAFPLALDNVTVTIPVNDQDSSDRYLLRIGSTSSEVKVAAVEFKKRGASAAMGKATGSPQVQEWFDSYGLKKPSSADFKDWASLNSAVIKSMTKRLQLIKKNFSGMNIDIKAFATDLEIMSRKTQSVSELRGVINIFQILIYGELFARAKEDDLLGELLQDWYLAAKKNTEDSAPFVKITDL